MRVIGSAVFVIWMYGLMVVMGLLCAPSLVGPRSWALACFRAWLGLVFFGLKLFCGVTYEVRGREHLPRGGALIASKHQSMFETLALWTILDDPAIILKKELKALPVFGWYAMKLRNIAVDRSAGSKALRDMLENAEAPTTEAAKKEIRRRSSQVISVTG